MAEILTLPSGYSQLSVTFVTTPEPSDEPPRSTGFVWTIHPKRRLHKFLDERRHRRKFARVSLNNDFRAWRRVVVYPQHKRPYEHEVIIW